MYHHGGIEIDHGAIERCLGELSDCKFPNRTNELIRMGGYTRPGDLSKLLKDNTDMVEPAQGHRWNGVLAAYNEAVEGGTGDCGIWRDQQEEGGSL